MRTTLQPSTLRRPPLRLPILLGLVLAVALGAAACSTASATRIGRERPGSLGQGQLVDIGGRDLYLECRGTGTPTVVFVAGLGDSGEAAWRMVWGQVARSARACVYDRAGAGRSDPGPTPAGYQRAVDDLHVLLRRGHVQGPYVLVGHSLGGLLARLYARGHPAEVAGVVLVDGTPVDWFSIVQRLLPAALRGPLAHNPEGFDLSHGLASLTPFDRAGALGRRPLAVLWAPNQPPAGLPAATAEELGGRWEAEQARLGRLSAASRLQQVAAGGHYLQRDQPQLVVDASTRSCARRNAPPQPGDQAQSTAWPASHAQQEGTGSMQDRPADYQDPLVVIQHGRLVIMRYYFPTGAKPIRLRAITGVEEYPMSKATGRWRTWGSGNLVHWFNLDPGRRHKRQAFVIDLGRRAKPVVTPDDPEAFRAALVAAGIRIASTAPGGGGQRP